MADEFRFERDLARATTVPAAWYTDPAALEREKERVFARTWQLVGYASQLARPGDSLLVEVAGEPLVVVRGEDERPRAFSAVCRHRAGPIGCDPSRRGVLRCGYHGWTYDLAGRLLGTPEFEGVLAFDREAARLPGVRVETFASLVFVNLDADAPSLSDALGEIPAETAELDLSAMCLYRRHDYEIACNWKVYVDNYLEGYHIPVVHPGLFREIDYGAYRVETRGQHSRHHAPVRSKSKDSLYRRHLGTSRGPEALYYWLFPNLMLNVYPDNVQVNLIVPLGHERTLTRFEWLVPDPARPGLAAELERSFAFSDEVQREDVAICEAVQRGLRSRTYDRGRFSVRRENGVHHFHGLLAAALGEGR
jgi:choline monooxygenase